MASVHQPSSNPKRRSMSIKASEPYIGNRGATSPERGRRSKGRDGCVPAHARQVRSTPGAVVVPVLSCSLIVPRAPERLCLPGELFSVAARPPGAPIDQRAMKGSSGSIQAELIIRTSPHPYRIPRNMPACSRTKTRARHPLVGHEDQARRRRATHRGFAAYCVPVNKVTCTSKIELEQEWRS
jgi:hypothetical protein